MELIFLLTHGGELSWNSPNSLFLIILQKKFADCFVAPDLRPTMQHMENAPLNTLMIEVLRRTTAAFPELHAQLDAYLQMKAKTEERDKDGKLSTAARKARETLRNPLLVQMPLKRASRQHEKATRKSRAKAMKVITEGLLLYVDYDQHQIEKDILDEDDLTIDRDVTPSRERTDQDKLDAMARPFFERLTKRKIAPSTLGRLTDLPTDFIARLIIDLHDDPDFQNPQNLWVQMMRAGILDAFTDSMTPEEAAAIDYAGHTLKEDNGAAEFARKAREDCGLPAGFSTMFLEGLYHLYVGLAGISAGQARAYSRAFMLVRDRDVDLLGKVLGLSDNADLDRLQALVHFVTNRTRFELDNTPFEIQLASVKQGFERLDAHNRTTDDWARDVPNMIASLARDFADTVPGPEAFEMLLASGFSLSSTYEEVSLLAERRREHERHEMFLDDIRWACKMDQRFKVVGQTVHLEWDDGFEDIVARAWDQASWEAEHGPLFDYCDAMDDPDDEPISSGTELRKGGEVDTVGPSRNTGDPPRLNDNQADPATLSEEIETSSSGTSNLPVTTASQAPVSASLFDFEQRQKPNDAPLDDMCQPRAERSSSTQKPREMTRKPIDKLTDEDFR